MKKYLLFLLLIPSLSFAQPDVTIKPWCVDLKKLNEVLDEFDEVPFVRGLSQRDAGTTSLVVFVSKEKKTWSIVEKISNDAYCFIAVGNVFEPVPSEIHEEREKTLKQKKGQQL